MSSESVADTSDCHFCARQTNIQEHHIVPQRFKGSDDRENLVGVCERCHKKLERLYDKRFYERLGITDEKGERENHFPCLVCDSRATVKLSRHTGNDWFCLQHGTELYEQYPKTTFLKKDLTGHATARFHWIDACRENGIDPRSGEVPA